LHGVGGEGDEQMRTPQLITVALAAAAIATASACSRAQTQQQTQRAAAEVKGAAARAGEALQDGWLTTRIQAQYFADNQVKARYVDVSTRDRVVTIKGYVDSPAARERALQIARATDGVRQVNDQLLIGQSPAAFAAESQPVATSGPATAGSGTAHPDDARVTASIQARFFLDSAVKPRQIDVATHDGVVTLKGTVASEDERAQALLLARTTEGVQRVEDDLTVDASLDRETASADDRAATPAGTSGVTPPRADDDALMNAVKATLAGDPAARSLDVSARDGVVMLQGQVASVQAKQRALAAARAADGVTQVVDRIRVAKR
jgi:hyperosmotically inducible protein